MVTRCTNRRILPRRFISSRRDRSRYGPDAETLVTMQVEAMIRSAQRVPAAKNDS